MDDRWTACVAFALFGVALTLAGCADPEPDAQDDVETTPPVTEHDVAPLAPPPAAPAPGYSYTCPGQPWPPAPVCSSLLVAPDAILAEPYLAIAPNDTRTLAVAANARSITTEDVLDVRTFVSQDGGATWRAGGRPALPDARLPTDSLLGDPVIVFLPDGSLLQSAMLCGLDGSCSILVARSEDLAASWSPWQVISSSASVDREWLSVQPDGSVLAHWTSGSGVEIVSSMDHGKTWQPRGRLQSCIGASPIETVAGMPHFACVDFTGTGPEGIRVVAQDDGAWVSMEDQRGLDMTWPRILFAPQGRLLVLEDYHNSSVAVRWADGPAWGPIVNVGDALSVDDGWTRTFSHWEAIDAWGRLHLLLGGEPSTAAAGPPDRVAMAYAHAVFDGATLVQEQALTSDPPVQLAQLPLGQVVVSSDYGGLAFIGQEGYLAWPEAGGIAFTRLVPA